MSCVVLCGVSLWSWCCWWSWCVFGVCVRVCLCVFVCCGTLKNVENPCVDSKTPPCVQSKRPGVCRHHAYMLKHMCAWCRYTRRRVERTHEGTFWTDTRWAKGVFVSSAYQHLPTCGHHLALEVLQRNPWISPIFSLRTSREQHVADSSNHSLCLIKLFSFSNLEVHCGRNQLWHGSKCLLSPLPPPPQQPQHTSTTTTRNSNSTQEQRQRHAHEHVHVHENDC